jgi:prepilin-type N-terminal cleavage/methylation domain-containing protein/prepilin-type processing-associated H-X9-DG protein
MRAEYPVVRHPLAWLRGVVPMQRANRRTGVTLMELLLVIGILGILAALLVPAIQRARETANRTACLNNLKQLGLALHAYHDSAAVLPPGLDGPQGPAPFVSWNARILPHLEQEQLWREIVQAYADDEDFRDIPPHVHRSTVVKTFSCPSDPRTLQPSTLLDPLKVAFTAYLGVEGTNQYTRDGMLFMDSRIRLADVTDGTSNTLLVGERPPSANQVFGWWYAGWGQSKDGSAEMVLGASEMNVREPTCAPGPYRFGPGSFGNQCDTFHFWSGHVGGANFLFADASARFLSYSASSVLPALATRAAGEAVSIPDGS